MIGRKSRFAVPLCCGVAILLLFTYPANCQDNRQNVSIFLNQNDTVLEQYGAALENSTTGEAGSHDFVHTEEDEEEDAVNYNLIAPTYEYHLEKSSIIYGLVKVANGSNVNPSCHRHLGSVRRGILRKEPWAMKVLDASGSKPPGFVFGQNFWFGSREACGAVRRPVGITLSDNYPRVMKQGIINDLAPFDMDYRVVYLKHRSPWQVEIKLMSEQVIHVGLCLPSSCHMTEIQSLMVDYISGGLFVENDIYDIQPDVLYVKDLQITAEFFERESFKLLSAFVAFTLAMVLIASYLRSRSQVAAIKDIDSASSSAGVVDTCIDDDELSLWNFPKLRNFITCFDIQENLSKMFSVKDSKPTEIPVINGLRSICAVWILLFHVMWYMYFTVHNKTFLISYAEKLFFQYISSAPIMVDVFFTISGFLQTYNFLRNTKKIETIRGNSFVQNAMQFFKSTFHRYLRLVPLYLVVMAVVDLLFVYIGKVSVYDINEKFDENCANYWWRNLFFIQNLFDHKDMCANWTWSLACEMQYFLIATILLFAYTKHPRCVKLITGTLLGANIMWSYGIGFNTNFQLSFDTLFTTGTDIYISPFVRVMPYIIGCIAGWAYVEYQLRPTDMSDFKESLCWNLSIIVFFVCQYSTVKRDVSPVTAISLFVVGRLLFSMAISWVIIGSAAGRGVVWSRFLEAKVFQHLNRISYAFYLLNPFVIAFFFGLTNSSTHADPFMLCVLCTGFTIIVYAASVLFSLAFEVPFCNWSSHLLRRSNTPPKAKSA
ncbi:nose resistant to fluoxetine protein 6 [Stomoxys calcitrans]|uniref:Nose resistant-to-fluoxetine protein N-terminal domain-containing protein n=1 Tax=Stomoxys calcitrans TaxID=35570 RepID=A0A1I8P5Q1_STOCA|nr:nose resistant to fluoxetine protein 6 [Stomoxys calcitrans]XP_013103773.1 nose resistant to fluoxetine protein 6 [Stomoxys calcitrans]